MRGRDCLIGFTFLISFFASAQNAPISNSRIKSVSERRNVDDNNSRQGSIGDKQKRPPVTDYKIISVENDTTVVDTSPRH